jgi:hypothetical protein
MDTTNVTAGLPESELAMKISARWFLLAAVALAAGCGPTFDPPSLVATTRVLGARVTAGSEAPSRATPAPGEAASVAWLVTGPTTPGNQGWAFALCQPALSGDLTCGSAPYAIYQGSEPQPVVAVTMPDAGALAGATSVLLYGRICDGAEPIFDPQTGLPGCARGAAGTTGAVTIAVASADSVNHNPAAERGLTLDGQAWPAPEPGADPCVAGPVIRAGTKDHLIDLATAGSDRGHARARGAAGLAVRHEGEVPERVRLRRCVRRVRRAGGRAEVGCAGSQGCRRRHTRLVHVRGAR